MDVTLLKIAGQIDETEITLTPPAVLGRSRSVDVAIGHPTISRRHCEMTMGSNGLLLVKDLGSLNGTFIEKQRILEETPLRPGALLTLGSVSFRAVYGQWMPLSEDSPTERRVEVGGGGLSSAPLSPPAFSSDSQTSDLSELLTSEALDPPTEAFEKFTPDPPPSDSSSPARGR